VHIRYARMEWNLLVAAAQRQYCFNHD